MSGPRLAAALIAGIRGAGVAVADLGMVATPMVYFAGFHLGSRSGVAITGSHNPPEYNGMKLTLAGDPVYGEALQRLRARIEAGGPRPAAAPGALRAVDVAEAYVARIAGDVRLARPMKVAIDCGNGVAGAIAPRLFRALGCDVVELFCEVDGRFPNHHPDPAHPENL
ncbi:MAG: phosphomannomutase/phosphoglucomutase, partial [Elioraea sp.]|nr:phosphomannomutase/phosphoglucomutase [Elioraea sp.]